MTLLPSTEIDFNIGYVGNAWGIIHKLLTLWKQDIANKIKQEFLQTVAVSVLLYGCTICT